MKKRIIAALFSVVLIAACFAGCSDSYGSLKVTGTQDTSYVVTSNGGNAVSYGNYIYYVNGYRGYADDDGKQNVWGSTVKGALYRAELNGTKVTQASGGNTFKAEVIDETGLEFKSTKGLDYDEEEIDVVDTQMIASKTIGTSGYAQGGIFIYDNFVYYATPNNQKNKVGAIQSAKTDFFRTRLDGKVTQRIYTTDADSATSPYGFYKQGDFVYLNVLDGTNIKSVKMNASKIVGDATIAEDVTAAYFPVKKTYYSGISTNGAEDFVYFTRDVAEGDSQRAGNVIEIMRPDGKERVIFLMNGETSSIEGVRDGMFFYRTLENKTNNVINYTNLHKFFTDNVAKAGDKAEYNSPSYQAAYEKLSAEEKAKIGDISGTLISASDLSGYTYTYAFRPNLLGNITYLLAAKSDGLYIYNSGKTGYKIYNGEATVKCVDGNYVYFTDSTGTSIFRTNMFTVAADNTVDTLITEITAFGDLELDICAGYIVFFDYVDEWADSYTHFLKVDGLEGAEPVFVGERQEADVKPEDDEEEEETTEE